MAVQQGPPSAGLFTDMGLLEFKSELRGAVHAALTAQMPELLRQLRDALREELHVAGEACVGPSKTAASRADGFSPPRHMGPRPSRRKLTGSAVRDEVWRMFTKDCDGDAVPMKPSFSRSRTTALAVPSPKLSRHPSELSLTSGHARSPGGGAGASPRLLLGRPAPAWGGQGGDMSCPESLSPSLRSVKHERSLRSGRSAATSDRTCSPAKQQVLHVVSTDSLEAPARPAALPVESRDQHASEDETLDAVVPMHMKSMKSNFSRKSKRSGSAKSVETVHTAGRSLESGSSSLVSGRTRGGVSFGTSPARPRNKVTQVSRFGGNSVSKHSVARQRTRMSFSGAMGPSMAFINALVRHQGFTWFFCGLIVLNGVMLGAHTDVVARNGGIGEGPIGFMVVEGCFCTAFTVELLLRVLVFRSRFFCRKGCGWNYFDLCMVALQMVEVCTAIFGKDLPKNMAMARILRVLRLFRVVRLVRFLRLVRDLRLLVASILISMKSLGWTVILLAVMIYCVSLVLTQLVNDYRADAVRDTVNYELLEKYYGSVGRSMLSLFQAVTGGVDWDQLVDPLIQEISSICAIVFALYIAFATLAMMNVVTGIFVENVLLSARTDKDASLVANARDIFRTLDDGITGEMTLESWLEKVETPQMREFFKGIDVDPTEAASLFGLIDLDDSGSIDAEEFLRACVRLRGPAMALDTAVLVQQVRQLGNELYDFRLQLESACGAPIPEEPEPLEDAEITRVCSPK